MVWLGLGLVLGPDPSPNPSPNPNPNPNTAQIYEYMLSHMEPGTCTREPRDGGEDGARVVLLTHPDHLRRALRIGETTFAGVAGGCRGLQLVPAMQPYTVDWPSAASEVGPRLNLYAGVSCHVHTGGEVRAG